jgi:hypothetical protein
VGEAISTDRSRKFYGRLFFSQCDARSTVYTSEYTSVIEETPRSKKLVAVVEILWW